jgi:hypothetical protein
MSRLRATVVVTRRRDHLIEIDSQRRRWETSPPSVLVI